MGQIVYSFFPPHWFIGLMTLGRFWALEVSLENFLVPLVGHKLT